MAPRRPGRADDLARRSGGGTVSAPERAGDTASGLSFDDLVALAALGVSRKGFTAAELDGPAAGYAGVLDSGDPAAALLDAAALLTVAGRAGVQPRRETATPPSAVAAGT